MAEILLTRGKRTDNGKWVEGYYVHLHDNKGHESHRVYSGYTESDCGEFYPDFFEVEPETIGQYTGLTDNNGTKIFEGDIIRNGEFDEEDGYGVVEFSDGAFEVNGHGLSCTFHENFWGTDCEVVGNICDNPELLGGTDNGE